jgi:hypothetical protein
VPDPGLGKAITQATISFFGAELLTGLSVAAREESALRTNGVVVIVFIRKVPVA